MNEFYVAVNNFLEELRCDSDEREFAISTEDVLSAKKELEKRSAIAEKYLEKLSEADKSIFGEYVEALGHLHFPR